MYTTAIKVLNGNLNEEDFNRFSSALFTNIESSNKTKLTAMEIKDGLGLFNSRDDFTKNDLDYISDVVEIFCNDIRGCVKFVTYSKSKREYIYKFNMTDKGCKLGLWR